MFGKNKVVIKTKKGRGPIRKLKVAIGVGALAMVIKPVLEPFLEGWLGAVPDGLVEQIAEVLLTSYDMIAVLVAAYMARPGQDDGVTVTR